MIVHNESAQRQLLLTIILDETVNSLRAQYCASHSSMSAVVDQTYRNAAPVAPSAKHLRITVDAIVSRRTR